MAGQYENCDVAREEASIGRGGIDAPVIYVIDSPEHPFDIETAAANAFCTIVKVPVANWNDSLTPWPAPGLYRGDPDFGGNGAQTLDWLCESAIPAIERAANLHPKERTICGYSLGGLFALYAFAHRELFDACACLSGSLWYEGWVEHLRELELDGAGRFAFFSIGAKEKRAALETLRRVQDNMQECVDILRERGCTVEFSIGAGNHMSHVQERFAAGISALDGFLAASMFPCG